MHVCVYIYIYIYIYALTYVALSTASDIRGELRDLESAAHPVAAWNTYIYIYIHT